MKKSILLIIFSIAFASLAVAQKAEKNNYVKFNTDSGSCIVRLYNETPLHRDNFIKLANQHFFDSLMFHRVIKNFMIQGGDPDSKHAASGIQLGEGDVGYTVP